MGGAHYRRRCSGVVQVGRSSGAGLHPSVSRNRRLTGGRVRSASASVRLCAANDDNVDAVLAASATQVSLALVAKAVGATPVRSKTAREISRATKAIARGNRTSGGRVSGGVDASAAARPAPPPRALMPSTRACPKPIGTRLAEDVVGDVDDVSQAPPNGNADAAGGQSDRDSQPTCGGDGSSSVASDVGGDESLGSSDVGRLGSLGPFKVSFSEAVTV